MVCTLGLHHLISSHRFKIFGTCGEYKTIPKKIEKYEDTTIINVNGEGCYMLHIIVPL